MLVDGGWGLIKVKLCRKTFNVASEKENMKVNEFQIKIAKGNS